MNLKKIREQLNISQRKLCMDLIIPTTTYNGYEKGRSEPDIQTLCKIADYFNVSLDYLCGHETKSFFDFGPLTENQKKIIINTTKLDKDNQILALVYTQGLLDTQSIGV